jgi:glycosyltransferase involved in cell wall biosynthesis
MSAIYPSITHTFIQREIAALRLSGVHVETLSSRKPPDKENVGAEQNSEWQNTRFILPACRPWNLLKTHSRLLLKSPRRYFGALKTALLVRPAGLKSIVWQMAYFAQAGIVAGHLSDHRLTHLHNHFAMSSCSVAMLASQMGGFTFSFTMHGPTELYEPKFYQLQEKIKRALFVCCISHFCRSQAMAFSPADQWGKLHIVHCGVDPTLFNPVEHSGEAGRLLFVGRFAAAKGLPILLEAIAELNQVRGRSCTLTIAGGGPDEAAMKRQISELGIGEHVKFVGYQSQAQIRELMSDTDVFVMASFAEGVPVVLMEAMAGGVPVVATAIAGIPELVDDGASGFLAPPGDVHSLAQRIDELLADPQLRRRFGQAGRLKVEAEFNITTESKRLVRIMTSALAGRPCAIRPEPVADRSEPASCGM